MKRLLLSLLFAGLSPCVLLAESIGYEQPGLHLTESTGIDRMDLIEPADTLLGWELVWTAGLHGSQVAYSNWSKGGVSSMSLNSNSLVQLIHRRPRFSYEFRVRSRYGQARFEEEGVRKTDDQILIRNRFLYDVDAEASRYRLFGNITFESQFTRGYNYGGGEEGQDLLISDFLAPAYFSQNAGLAWFPDAEFSIEGGFGLKQTIVADTSLSTRYGLDEGMRFKMEAGLTVGVNYESELFENIYYRGSLETFTNLFRPVRRTDVAFSNQLIGQVNSAVQVQFRFDLVYDDDFSNKLQLNQLLSAGVSVQIR